MSTRKQLGSPSKPQRIKAHKKLARITSQLTQAGGDPADTLKLTQDQAADFAEWASGKPTDMTTYYLTYPRAGGRAILAVEGAFPTDTHILVMQVQPIENGCYVAECGDVYNSEGVYSGILPEKHPARDRLPPKAV